MPSGRMENFSVASVFFSASVVQSSSLAWRDEVSRTFVLAEKRLNRQVRQGPQSFAKIFNKKSLRLPSLAALRFDG